MNRPPLFGDAELLEQIAHQAMLDYGLEPEWSDDAQRQLDRLPERPATAGDAEDLRELPWCSIDNDDSMDIDQLTVAEILDGGRTRVRVAVADVDALVELGSPLDRRAQHNTTSVYTGVRTFPMLPDRLSTDLTSLNEGCDRLALCTSLEIGEDGTIQDARVAPAWVHNHAKLAYPSVAAWLSKSAALPKVDDRPELSSQLVLQDRIAQQLRQRRYEHGALELETIEPRALMVGGRVQDLIYNPKNRAEELIEDLMIAANTAVSRYLANQGFPSFRRILRSPDRWDKIADVAARYGATLPEAPAAQPLAGFLAERRQADPLRFPDLSLTIVKLIGRGEYVVQEPNSTEAGHFGLAIRAYTHSTAPNRRYPDLITHRLVKAALAGDHRPYSLGALEELARHSTEREAAAEKVERRVRKSISAALVEDSIGESFEAVVTGSSYKGTWVRVLEPPVEGKLIAGDGGLDVGDRLQVTLVAADVARGYIDFETK